jgi:alanyl-tRNA synthetase
VTRASLAMKADLARYRAQEMQVGAERVRSGLAVCQVVEGDMAWLKLLASEITSRPGRIAVLVSNETPAGVVVAVSSDTGIAANKVLADLLTRFGGRGGGKADLAQGGGLPAPPESVVAHARTALADT